MNDDAAFEQFYRQYYGIVRAQAARWFGTADADDIAQETMLRALRCFDELDQDRSPWPWLLRVTRNVGIDRSRRQRPVALADDDLALLTPAVPDRSTQVAARVDLRRPLRLALRRLTALDQQVLLLHEVGGLDIGAIAATSGTTANAVRQRLFRARTKLARHYQDVGGSEYALPLHLPLAPGRRLVEPLSRATDAVTRALGLPDLPERGTAVAAAALLAAAAGITAPSVPDGSRDRPQVARPPAAVAPAAPRTPLVAALPAGAATTAVDTAVRTVGSLVGGPQPAHAVEGWERGLAGWSVRGVTAAADCTEARAGVCSLRLEPADTVSVARAYDVPFAGVGTVRFSVKTSLGGGATFQLTVRLDQDTVTVTLVPGAQPKLRLAGGNGRSGPDIGLWHPGEWNDLWLVLDRARGQVKLAQAGVHDGTLTAVAPLRRAAGRVTGVELAGTRTAGGEVLYVDELAIESTAQCADGLDNDGDGRVDGADPACRASGARLTESPDYECWDGIDNDADGALDGADSGCGRYDSVSESPECSNGRDDDGDGAVDGADGQCLSAADPSELPQCSDGFDEDFDGATDFPADRGCRDPADETEWACTTVAATELLGPVPLHPVWKGAVGACLDPVDEVARLVLAPPERTDAVAYVDRYAFGPFVLRCVTLVRDGATAAPCAASASFIARESALVRATVEPLAAAPGQPAGVCTARLMVVLATGIADAPLRGRWLTVC